MGGSSSKQEKLEILNDTRVKNSLKKFNETINETMLKTIQTTTQNVSQSILSIQSVGSNLTSAKDIVQEISDVNQKATSKADLTALQKTEVQTEVAKKTLSEMQTTVANMMDLSQSNKNAQEEQMIKGLLNAVENTALGAAAMVTGGDHNVSTEKKIQNLLNVENSTELTNKVKNSVSQEMVNDTISNIANSTQARQEVGSNLQSDGNIFQRINAISQEITQTMATEAIQESGVAASIISELVGIDKTDVETAIKTTQANENKEAGTFQGFGDMVNKMFQGNTIMMIVFSLMCILSSVSSGGAVFMSSKGGVMSNLSKMQKGGNKISQYIKMVKKIDTFYLIIAFLIALFLYMIAKVIYKENFKEDQYNVYLKVGDKYVDNNLCLKETIDNEVQKGNVLVTGDNEIMFHYEDKNILSVSSDKLIKTSYEMLNIENYKFQVKDGVLKHGNYVIVLNENCLMLSTDESLAIKFNFTDN